MLIKKFQNSYANFCQGGVLFSSSIFWEILFLSLSYIMIGFQCSLMIGPGLTTKDI